MSDPIDSPDAGTTEEATTEPLGEVRGSGLAKGRVVAAAAAIAVGLVAAVVIVSLTSESGDESADPSDTVDIAAEEGTSKNPSTDADDGPTEARDAWDVTTTGPFEIDLQPAETGLATITVNDRATPTLAGSEAQHCVLVTLTGPAMVEAYGCTALDGTGTVELALSAPGAALVGCAATATNEAVGEPGTVEATTTFAVSEGAELPAGDYDVTVSAVTGTGDGCPPADGSAEREATAETTITVT